MRYSIDTDHIDLSDLRKRIEETDLIPSRQPLLDGIEQKFDALESHGIATFGCLREELKNNKRMEALSVKTKISVEYLVLLRREIEGYLPKPFQLTEFNWLPQNEIAKLQTVEIRNTADLYEALDSLVDTNNLQEKTGIDPAVLEDLIRLVDLTRVQWTSPTTARMVIEASYGSVEKLASAQAEELHAALQHINDGGRYFKGQIGLRDIKRLIKAAGYLADNQPIDTR